MSRLRELFVTLLVLAGCQDQGVKPVNGPPSAAITFPDDGGVVDAEVPIQLTGVVGDIDDPVDLLSVRWTVDGAEVCAPAPDASGLVFCEVTLDEGEHELELAVTDPAGAVTTDAISVTATRGEPPEAEVWSPEEGAVYAYGTTVRLEGQVRDAETPAEALEVRWEEPAGIELPIEAEPDSSGMVTALYTFEPGTHLLTLRVTDAAGLEDTASVAFIVDPKDTPPSCLVTAPADGSTFAVGDPVTLQAWVADADTEPTRLDIAWSSDRDGSLGASVADSAGIASLTTSTLTPGPHVVTLAVTDAAGHSCTDTVSITLLDPPTVRILAPTDGELVTEGATVLLQAEVLDSYDAPDALALSWASDRDGPLASPSPDATGFASASVVLSTGEHTLTATVMDLDGLTATAVVTLTVDGAPSAPTVSLTPASPGTDDDLQATLSAPSVDPEGATVTYRYDWYVDGLLSSASTTSTLPASATTRGQVWRVVVTPSDGLQDGASGEASVTVVNTAPTVTSATLSPGTAYTDDTLTASATTDDADGDAVSVTWTWYVDGVAVGATGSTLAGTTWFDKHQSVHAVATPSDGTDSGAGLATAAVTIQNSPPSAPGLDIQPADPIEGTDDLWCEVATASTDADGDAVDYTFAWDVDGAAFGGATTTVYADDTVPRSATLAAERWTCTVTPADEEESGTAASVAVYVLGEPVGYAHTQYPCSGSVAAGGSFTVYGWVWMPGVTDAVGEGTRVDAEAGVGPDGTYPWASSGWTWFTATYNTDVDGPLPDDHANDEYVATLTAPSTAGAYDYAYRFTTDGGLSWTYADLGGDTCALIGTTDGYDPATAGALTVY